MISFLIATATSKIIVDSIIAGAGLGISIYQASKYVSQRSGRRK